MIRKACLHIGFDKTGTSAIQRYLAENARMIRRQTGFLYPRIGRQKYEHIPVAQYAGFGFVGETRTEDEQRRDGQIGRFFQCDNREHIVISSEHFCYGTAPERFARIGALFAGYDVKIIVYVRTLPGWLRSLHGETVKWGFYAPFADFLVFHRERMDYAAFLDRWAAVFGAGALEVRLFDRERDRLIPSFLQILDPAMAMPRATIGVVNASIGPLDIEILKRQTVRLGHYAMDDAYRFYKFYAQLKRDAPELWHGFDNHGVYALPPETRGDILGLTEDFGQRYLSAKDRADFLAETARDLARPARTCFEFDGIDALCDHIADAWRRRSPPGWFGRMRGKIGGALGARASAGI
ncbi:MULTISPECIES: hypothetical protein [Rhodomicrobium]|uniref:hypothetical protein n=1 Tax=Rhodomicrobium TaxID=1068 RepID=UPI000B4BC64C|nr:MULTISPECIES: hypothetical protein [Rhodomicrobium]